MVKILFFIFVLISSIYCANRQDFQRDEAYKDLPTYVYDPYDAAFYILFAYDKLKKKEGYIKELPKISKDEIDKIRKFSSVDNNLSK